MICWWQGVQVSALKRKVTNCTAHCNPGADWYSFKKMKLVHLCPKNTNALLIQMCNSMTRRYQHFQQGHFQVVLKLFFIWKMDLTMTRPTKNSDPHQMHCSHFALPMRLSYQERLEVQRRCYRILLANSCSKTSPYLVINQFLDKMKQNRQRSVPTVTGLLTVDRIVQQPGVIQNHHSQTSSHGERNPNWHLTCIETLQRWTLTQPITASPT